MHTEFRRQDTSEFFRAIVFVRHVPFELIDQTDVANMNVQLDRDAKRCVELHFL